MIRVLQQRRVNASRWDCTLEPTGDGTRFAVRLGLRMVKGLANAHAAAIVAARGDEPFATVDDLWRRAGVPVAALTPIAEADGFRPALSLVRQEALWAIRGLRDEELPLFAAASAREGATVAEVDEPSVLLRPMVAGREVVEDYRHTGLSLRRHPVAFLRADLARHRIVTCAEAMGSPDRRWLEAAGIVLVRQRPGSAKDVLFITVEDETGIANLVVWKKVFGQYRRVILSSSMIAVKGRIQREGEVVHLVVHRVADLSRDLASVGEREAAFLLPDSQGRERHQESLTPDPRGLSPKGPQTHGMAVPDLHIDPIRVKTRDFR